MITWQELLKQGIDKLSSANIDDAEFDATQLALKLFGKSRSEFIASKSDYVGEETVIRYHDFIIQRINRVPLQYILGEWDFYESTFCVGEGVLIPRSETEELVDICVDIINRNNYTVVYDLCSGSGCIGLSIAKKLPAVRCFLFELYDTPVEYIKKNKELLSIDNAEIIRCDILNPEMYEIPNADLIVSNPPYIQSGEIDSLQLEVQMEPITALDGGNDGLLFYRAIADKWLKNLASGGSVALECGEDQPPVVIDLFDKFNIKQMYVDLYGTERFVIAEDYLKGDL